MVFNYAPKVFNTTSALVSEQFDETQDRLDVIISEIDVKKDKDGLFVDSSFELEEQDKWGNKINVHSGRQRDSEVVISFVAATSAGPDGKFNTDDDISARKYIKMKHILCIIGFHKMGNHKYLNELGTSR